MPSRRWPGGVPAKVIETIRHEMQIIEELHYEAYFLTVWDLVRFARERDILCQGRGRQPIRRSVIAWASPTSIPAKSDLLFERFVSRERDEAPDIDVDFEHQRREEVLQYLYEQVRSRSRGHDRDRDDLSNQKRHSRSRQGVGRIG